MLRGRCTFLREEFVYLLWICVSFLELETFSNRVLNSSASLRRIIAKQLLSFLEFNHVPWIFLRLGGFFFFFFYNVVELQSCSNFSFEIRTLDLCEFSDWNLRQHMKFAPDRNRTLCSMVPWNHGLTTKQIKNPYNVSFNHHTCMIFKCGNNSSAKCLETVLACEHHK